jgi:hypothetical protein
MVVRAVHEYESMMRFNSAMHDGEAEPAAAGFGRHEGLKKSVLYRFRYPATLIGDSQHQPAAREMLRLRRKLMMSELDCFDPDLSARGRCLHRIEEQVEDRPVQQIVIANDDQGGRRKHLSNRHLLRFVRVCANQSGGVTRDLD